MANINIPESVIPGIKAIGLLSEKEINSLYENLRNFPKGVKVDELKKAFSKTLGEEVGDPVSIAIYSFGYLLLNENATTQEISENLKESFLSQVKEDDIAQELGEIIKERLNDILMLSDFLIPTFEANRLVWDNNTVLLATGISTETLILNDKMYSIPASGIILNKLKIEYKKDDKNRDAVFTLDTNDLVKLKSQIDLALKEVEEIQKQYSSFITFIDL